MDPASFQWMGDAAEFPAWPAAPGYRRRRDLFGRLNRFLLQPLGYRHVSLRAPAGTRMGAGILQRNIPLGALCPLAQAPGGVAHLLGRGFIHH